MKFTNKDIKNAVGEVIGHFEVIDEKRVIVQAHITDEEFLKEYRKSAVEGLSFIKDPRTVLIVGKLGPKGGDIAFPSEAQYQYEDIEWSKLLRDNDKKRVDVWSASPFGEKIRTLGWVYRD